jgi:hypothetical protein
LSFFLFLQGGTNNWIGTTSSSNVTQQLQKIDSDQKTTATEKQEAKRELEKKKTEADKRRMTGANNSNSNKRNWIGEGWKKPDPDVFDASKSNTATIQCPLCYLWFWKSNTSAGKHSPSPGKCMKGVGGGSDSPKQHKKDINKVHNKNLKQQGKSKK